MSPVSTSTLAPRAAASCAVVWNAWTNDKTIADMGEGNHVGYLCVERGDVADYANHIEPPAEAYEQKKPWQKGEGKSWKKDGEWKKGGDWKKGAQLARQITRCG